MTAPFYSDDWLTILGGDCRDVLRDLADESIDCVVTSPPYWNLRDYGTATWTGGDPECDHKRTRESPRSSRAPGRLVGGTASIDAADVAQHTFREACGRCGARRVDQQLGLEATPDEYVERIVDVFREVRRVLKKSGTLWLNLGDSYIDRANASQGALHRRRRDKQMPPRLAPRPPGLKDKDLAGVPFRVVLALQADGWWWRQTVIWNKPNPMPESVEDRPTTAHEYLFLLTRSARYYYDQEAVREPASASTHARLSQDVAAQAGSARANGGVRADRPMKAVQRRDKQSEVAESKPRGSDHRMAGFNERWRKSQEGRGDGLVRSHDQWHAAHALPVPDRNMRSVWTIPTQPYRGAHFAVFPPELPRRCIAAGSSERGVCPECGAPWRRTVEVLESWRDGAVAIPQAYGPGSGNRTARSQSGGMSMNRTETIGWESSCGHEVEPVPATVLDPFGGSGTVGMVAQRLRRRAVLIDLNPAYLEQQLERAAREWGRGGKRLVDREVEPPPDSLWAAVATGAEAAS